ncbi:hypothetical protein [Rasiella sp. SM2506]|uniref:hypothetical protein n=1 Tax=Rasiella sp. SM2506 TaxID=3423914 RepID=UPI003D7AE364
MKTISYFFSFLILFPTLYSCAKETEISEKYELTIIDVSQFQNSTSRVASTTYNPLLSLPTYPNNGAFVTLQNWKNDEGINVNYPNTISPMMNNDYWTNYNIIEDMNIFTSAELNVINSLANDIQAGFSVQASVNNFQNDIQNLPYYAQKQNMFNAIANGLLMLDNAFPGQYFQNRNPCARATVGLVLAFAGLCVSGATVVGAAVGAAGFIWASAEMGNACKR